MQFTGIKVSEGIIPYGEADCLQYERLKFDKMFLIEIKYTRDIILHRKYFAMLHCAYNNMHEKYSEIYPSFDLFRDAVLIAIGHCEKLYTLTGEVYLKAKSLSFAKTDELKFRHIYTSSVAIVLKTVLKGVDQWRFEEVLEFY